MLNLLSRIAVQNTDTPSSIATLTNIMDGVDGAAVFGYNVETEDVRTEDNQTQIYSHIHTLDIRVLETTADSAILDAIVSGTIKAKISGYSPDGFFIWDEPAYIMRNKQYDNVLASAVMATQKSTPGFRGTPRKRPVHAGANLLGVYDVGELTTADLKTRSIFFPFAGLTLTASSSSGDVGFSFRDSADAELSVSTGTSPHSAVIPANTVYIRLAGGATIANPMISINGNTTFTL